MLSCEVLTKLREEVWVGWGRGCGKTTIKWCIHTCGTNCRRHSVLSFLMKSLMLLQDRPCIMGMTGYPGDFPRSVLQEPQMTVRNTGLRPLKENGYGPDDGMVRKMFEIVNLNPEHNHYPHQSGS